MSVYVAPNPTLETAGVRHSAKDVTHWSFFFFDIDPVSPAYNPHCALDEVLRRFGGWAAHDLLKHKPTIIDSGRGLQAWLRVNDRILTDDPVPEPYPVVIEGEEIMTKSLRFNPFKGPINRDVVRRAMSYWLKKTGDRVGESFGCKIDTSCSDLPRVMRMPGTVNIKTGRMTEILHVQEKQFGWLPPVLIGGCPDGVLVAPEPSKIPEGTNWQMVWSHLTITAQSYLKSGMEEPGRHKTVSHVAKSFKELGISREQAAKAIYRANKLRGPDQELSPKDVEHALDTAGYEKTVDKTDGNCYTSL